VTWFYANIQAVFKFAWREIETASETYTHFIFTLDMFIYRLPLHQKSQTWEIENRVLRKQMIVFFLV